MVRVPTVRPTVNENGGAKLLLVIAALLVAAWAGIIFFSGWLLVGP
jgi:hypothetical protein